MEEPRVEVPEKKKQWVGGKHGVKLTAAVERLEKARELAWSDDAIFLLAEMNFVSPRGCGGGG